MAQSMQKNSLVSELQKEVLSESEDDDGTPYLTDKGSEKLLKEIIIIQSNAEEKWTCDLCEREQSPKNNYFFSTVVLCSTCFDTAI